MRTPFTHNLYTGSPRDPRDIASDPFAVLCVAPGEPLRPAQAPSAPVARQPLENIEQLDDRADFEAWKGYELPALNNHGQFHQDWLHREFVAFKAGKARVALSVKAEPAAIPVLYTCVGKGGEYELIGTAKGAGTVRHLDDLRVYRGGGRLYFRTTDDFDARMRRIDTALVPAAGVQGDDLIGMSVSVDVSTGDDDAGDRLFGTIEGVQQYDGAKHGLMLLITDPKPNFTVPDSGRDAALPTGWSVRVTDHGDRTGVVDISGPGVFNMEMPVKYSMLDFFAALAAHPAPSSDAARLDAFIDWYLRGGQRAEIHPNGHMAQTTRAIVIAALDAMAAHPANGAQADLVTKINALRVRGVNYENGVPARQLVDRAEVLALLGGAS